MRRWKIEIPVTPKAVQSFRMGKHGGFVSKDVREWKAEVTPHISRQSFGSPSRLPIEAVSLSYYFKLPQKAPDHIRRYVEAGGLIPYMASADLTDNLSKGVIDCCKGIIFEDDRQIWRLGNVMKVYAIEPHMVLEFLECPSMRLVTGGVADESDDAISRDSMSIV